ncbi:hypothetical protein GA0115235_109224 [Streptomyces sp. DpondAA-F4a]|nr:hypothetical protein GA0115235_109224 [Streptomyces sp. DpondAA-F4a]
MDRARPVQHGRRRRGPSPGRPARPRLRGSHRSSRGGPLAADPGPLPTGRRPPPRARRPQGRPGRGAAPPAPRHPGHLPRRPAHRCRPGDDVAAVGRRADPLPVGRLRRRGPGDRDLRPRPCGGFRRHRRRRRRSGDRGAAPGVRHGRHLPGRPGAHLLHLGHHGHRQGHRARPPHAARAQRVPVLPRPASGRRVLRRRGLGLVHGQADGPAPRGCRASRVPAGRRLRPGRSARRHVP